MNSVLIAIAILVFSALPSAFLGRRFGRVSFIATAGVIIASAVMIPAALSALIYRNISAFDHALSIPLASFSVGLDPLSAFFIIPIALLAALSSIYGESYMRGHGKMGPCKSPFHFNILIASMLLVVLARNGILFLIAWEVMAISSFFLVAFDDDEERSRRASILYLIAMHVGSAFILILFALMAAHSGSMEFVSWKAHASVFPYAGVAFVIAIIGFGAKAGFFPLHVWLPKAHPAAPSHVSAVMSGIMIKMGIYGIIRTLQFLPMPSHHWGSILIAVGASSGIIGIVYALAKHEIKSQLAYCSMENVGIIAIGLGLCLVAISYGMIPMAAIAGAGAIIHILNHAIFKGALFLGAGSVIGAAGTGELDRLGGLMKRMPWTASSFLIGSASITGIPPFNGFIGEFLIFQSAILMIVASGGAIGVAIPAVVAVVSMGLIGGLSIAAFVKGFGAIFLGEPRSQRACNAIESSRSIYLPPLILAMSCIAIGLLAPTFIGLILGVVSEIVGQDVDLADSIAALTKITMISAALIASVSILLLIRKVLLSKREVRIVPTWDCGYANPQASMQYTASSFARPLIDIFAGSLSIKSHSDRVCGIFPRSGSKSTRLMDVALMKIFRPLYASLVAGSRRLSIIQHGDIHLYILYIALTFIILLAATFGGW